MAYGLPDLGPKTPKGLSQHARERLLHGSHHDLDEGIITPHGDGTEQLAAHCPPKPRKTSNRRPSLTSSDFTTSIEPQGLDHATNAPTITTSQAILGAAAHSREILDEKIRAAASFCAGFDETATAFADSPAAGFVRELAQHLIRLCDALITGNALPTQQAAAIPTDTNTPQRNTYADKLRKGLPQENILNSQHPPIMPKQNKPAKAQAAARGNDDRVFIRLHEQSPATALEPYALRTTLAAALNVELDRIPYAKKTKTGWAVRAADHSTQQSILKGGSIICQTIGALKVEPAQMWYTYVIADVPRTLSQLFPATELHITETLIRNEAAAQAGTEPISVRESRHNNDACPMKTVLISFLKKPAKRFQLFGTSSWARIIEKLPPVTQCEKCWDFHPIRRCDRAQRCKTCGKNHIEDSLCTKTTQCTNCRGPHPADFTGCPARPMKQNGTLKRLTKAEKGKIRQLGERLFRIENPRTTPSVQGPASPLNPTSPPTDTDRPRSPIKRRRPNDDELPAIYE